MSLSIKSREAYELANELAQLTGSTMTAVVIDALRKQRDDLRRQQEKMVRVRELTNIAKRCAAHLDQPMRAVEHGDLLYDERGLPR